MNFNYRAVVKILSIIIMSLGISMIIPVFVALYFHETYEVIVFAFLGSISTGLAYTLKKHVYLRGSGLTTRDGYLIVSLCWLTASVLGSMPYVLSGVTPNFIDGFFEAVASFTTTGATILRLDEVPKSILVWKSLCNWLGGMGILILVISIIPAMDINAKPLADAEVPDSAIDKATNRISDSAKMLYIIYITFTSVEFLLLLAGPMNIFDAAINAMSSVSSSGLPSMRHSFTHYKSIYVEVIICTFSILASINFTLYYLIIRKNWRAAVKNMELRVFLCILAVASLLVTADLFLTGTYTLPKSIEYGFFHCISMGSTCGVSLTGHTTWPSFSLTVLFMLMLIGGCSFSTCGAIKVHRIIVLFKLVTRGFYRRIHPRSVVAVKIGGKAITAKKVSFITAFVLLYFIIILLSSAVLSLQGLDMLTTISSATAMLSNVGIGFGIVADGDFSVYARPLRMVLCFLMLCGRLEIFTFISLFMPSFWNPDKFKLR